MIRARVGTVFPVALYASLLVALLGLLRPQLFAPIEAVLQSVACLPIRAVSLVSGADHDPAADDRHALAAGLLDAAWRRVVDVDAARPPGVDLTWVPVPATVLERRGATSARPPDRLVLSVRREDLGAAAPFVTFREALVGFLDPAPLPDRDAAGAADALAGAAVVRALHHRVPRRVPAEIEVAGEGLLRMLVEPAAGADDGLLHGTMFDDHYLAAQLEADPGVVRTSGLATDPLGVLPRGLTIGAMRIFGYAVPGSDRVVPIDLRVEPAVSPAAVAHVVLWVPPEAAAARGRALRTEPATGREAVEVRVRAMPVPTEARTRWLATTVRSRFRTLTPGSAVVDGSRLIGVLDAAGAGFGVLAPFGQPERRWTVVLLPDDPSRGTLPLVVRVRSRDGARVVLEPVGVSLSELADVLPGQVLTGGTDGRVPAGLWVGPASLAPDAGFSVWHVGAAAMPPRLTVLGRRRGPEPSGVATTGEGR